MEEMHEFEGSSEPLMSTVSESVEVPFHEEQRSIIQMAPPSTVSTVTLAKDPIKSKSPPEVKAKRRFNCTVESCNYSTPYSKDLQRHMRKHTGEKPYSCDRCPKSFSRYDKLVMHIRVHEGSRPFKCTICNYASVDSSSLRKHQRTHTDERPYKCQICPYAAKESSQLVVHLRSHTGDSPYFCMEDGCDAAFKTPSDLQRHVRLHTGEKPFSCPLCPYKAAVKSNLNVHLRKHQTVPVKDDEQEEQPNVALKQSEPVLIPEPQYSKNDEDTLQSAADSCMKFTATELSNLSGNENSSDQIQSAEESETTTVTQEDTLISEEVDLSAQLEPLIHSSQNNQISSPKKPKKPKSERRINPGSNLPFQYACKQCSYKADTLKLFAVHMRKFHEDSDNSYLKCDLRKINGGGKVGRPRPTRRTKPSTTNTVNELEKFYDCSLCSASFVREDSLRCHMRQHSDPMPSTTGSRQNPVHLDDSGSTDNSSGGGLLFTYPNFCYQQTSSSNDISSQSKADTHEIQVASVITENPGVINSGSHHLFIIASGGTMQSIERNDFQFN